MRAALSLLVVFTMLTVQVALSAGIGFEERMGYNVTLTIHYNATDTNSSISITAVNASRKNLLGIFHDILVVADFVKAGGSGTGSAQICEAPTDCGLNLSISSTYFTDIAGNSVEPAPGKQVLIHFVINATPAETYASALVILEIHRYEPSTGTIIIDENMAIAVSRTLVGNGIDLTLMWWPKEPGYYIVRGYIWNGFPGQVDKWESYASYEQVISIS